ncbi:four helix bundle protein [Flavisolibacter sp. BT320]|nr:four helix bundle protein [Flavisolibacter longurius]
MDRWSYFPRRTVGTQFVDAADSISANIAEGYGRNSYKHRKLFCYYSRGSLMETKNWATKAVERKLLEKDEYDVLLEKLRILHYKLNIYSKKLKTN